MDLSNYEKGIFLGYICFLYAAMMHAMQMQECMQIITTSR